VSIQTLLAHPIFGTRYFVQTVHDGNCATLMGDNTFNSAAEAQRYFQWCLERSIINQIQSMRLQWNQVAMSNEMTSAGEGSQEKRLRVEVEPEFMAIRWKAEGGVDRHFVWDGRGEQRELLVVLQSI